MALTMTCDRKGCRSKKKVDFGVIPWDADWVVVKGRKRLDFCSFKCALVYARKQVADG